MQSLFGLADASQTHKQTFRGPLGVRTAAISYKAIARSRVQVVHSGMPVNRNAMITPVISM